MPEVYIHVVEGRTLDQKRQLIKEVTELGRAQLRGRARRGAD